MAALLAALVRDTRMIRRREKLTPSPAARETTDIPCFPSEWRASSSSAVRHVSLQYFR